MQKYLQTNEALELIKKNVKLEYLDQGFWFILSKDSPIRLLWEHKIRIKS